VILADAEIRRRMELRPGAERRIGVDPTPADHQVQPASLDLRLGEGFWFLDRPMGVLDPQEDNRHLFQMRSVDAVVLHTGQFCLGTTMESVRVPNDIVAHLEGKSSLARYGLVVHSTAGLIDPGFEGTITLELSNSGPAPLLLRSGTMVAQLMFSQMTGYVDRPYGHPGLRSHYQGQQGTTLPRVG
jgi:dCTP deaminase